MKSLTLSLASVLCILGYIFFKETSGSSVGHGIPTSVGEFPHQIFLKHNDNFRDSCGGNILNEEFILTSAHCVYGVRIQDIEIYAGVHDITPIFENTKYAPIPIKAKEVFVHPCYVEAQDNPNPLIKRFHDIALIKTATKIPLNGDTIKTIPIDEQNLESVSFLKSTYGLKEGILLGWGPEEPMDHYVSILRKSNFRLDPGNTDYCLDQDPDQKLEDNKAIAKYFYESHICSSDHGYHVCIRISGESGSLLCNNGQNEIYFLCGITTSLKNRERIPRPCGDRTVFTRIYYYRNWIKGRISDDLKPDPLDDCYEPPPLPSEKPITNPTRGQGLNKGQEGRSTCPTLMYGTFVIWIFHLHGRIFI